MSGKTTLYGLDITSGLKREEVTHHLHKATTIKLSFRWLNGEKARKIKRAAFSLAPMEYSCTVDGITESQILKPIRIHEISRKRFDLWLECAGGRL